MPGSNTRGHWILFHHVKCKLDWFGVSEHEQHQEFLLWFTLKKGLRMHSLNLLVQLFFKHCCFYFWNEETTWHVIWKCYELALWSHINLLSTPAGISANGPSPLSSALPSFLRNSGLAQHLRKALHSPLFSFCSLCFFVDGNAVSYQWPKS